MDTLVRSLYDLTISGIAIILPLFGVFISIFGSGIQLLIEKNQQEISSQEQSIKVLQQKLADQEISKLNRSVKEIQNELSSLRKQKKINERRISSLNPVRQIVLLLLTLFIGFILYNIYNSFKEFGYIFYFAPFVMSLLIVLFIKLLGDSLKMVVEAKKLIDEREQTTQKNIIDQLRIIGDNSAQHRIKDVFAIIDSKRITDDSLTFLVALNSEQKFNIGVTNMAMEMANEIEIGFIIPKVFTVNKVKSFTYVDSDKETIVRYKTELQAHTRVDAAEKLLMIPNLIGDFKIKTFVKGKNVETKYNVIQMKVKELLTKEVI